MDQALPWPAQDIAQWLPVWQAVGFFLATFVLEDVATVGAGLLLATGAVSWPVAFTSCFLGIWIGDAGLYALARFGGRSWFEKSSLRRFGKKVAASEKWFAERGIPILIFSRIIPGTRLPTYLAAGFLRVPLPRFLVVTGIAALIWTLVILFAVQVVGVKFLEWLGLLKHGGWTILFLAVVVWGGIHLLRGSLVNFEFRRFAAAVGRLRRWEFWPPWMFYPPVILYSCWLAIKYRGFTAATVANPGIFSGGLVGESKMATLCDLMATHPEFTAEAELLAGTTPAERLSSLLEICQRRGLKWPIILKPDLGQRGNGVKVIRSDEQARAYLEQTGAPIVVQRFAAGPGEAGIFYYRFPHETRGHIFAITEKVFPVVIGDGKTTLTELVWLDPRARFMADKYLERFTARRDEVLADGEKLSLVNAGNHAQGCIFLDGMRLCTPELAARIDAISQSVTGFNIGRYDIRYATEEDLKAGKNFQIIELNGAASEATSIYDARTSLFSAYRTLFHQWDLVFAIGAANRARGCPPAKFMDVYHRWRLYHQQAASYPLAD
jgi:membrane protein DedA with SNARE-associated domain